MEMDTSIGMSFRLRSTKLVRVLSLEIVTLFAYLPPQGIESNPSKIDDFMASVSSGPHSRNITFSEFRDFFLLLPRKISPAEIYQYYQLRKFLGDDGRGPARVNMEGNTLA